MVVVAPFVGVLLMHMLRLLKKDMSYSERFMYRIRTVQDTLFSRTATYHRSADSSFKPEPQESGAKAKEQAENLNSYYKEIKNDENSMHSLKVERMREMNE